MAEIAWPAGEKRSLIGKRISRLDGPLKSCGRAKYTHDVNLPNMLYAKIFSSPHAAAVVESVDTTAAEKMAGVEAVMVLLEPGERVNWAGQEIAAVAAITEELATEAIGRIKVSYKVERPLMDDRDPAKGEGRVRSKSSGDATQALRDAVVVAEGRYGCAAITHCCLEAHGQVAEFREGELHLWVSTQNVSGYAGQVASSAGLPANKIHVNGRFMGGGFGSKFGPDRWGVVGVQLAKQTGRPVKLMLDREQELAIAGQRPSAYADVEIGAAQDGTITAWKSKAWGSGGMGRAGAPPLPYIFRDIPNSETASQGIPINRGPARAWRAPNHPQGCLITMSAMEDLAAKLDMDALEFFLKNLHHTRMADVYREELQIAADLISYTKKSHRRGDRTPGPIKRGLGIALHTWGGAGHDSTCDVTIHSDGSVIANIGSQDLGTGTQTVIAIVVAETLGLPLEAVQVNIGRNAYPPDGASGGSTTVGGISSSSRRATTAALNELLEKVAPELGTSPDRLEATAGRIQEIGPAQRVSPGLQPPKRSMTWSQACALLGQASITQQGRHSRSGAGELTSSGVGGVQMADVSVDVETGVITINELVAVQDCGLIIDLETAESQVLGGVIMGITYALYEEAIYDPQTGRMLNADMEFYKLAGLADIGDIKVHMMTGKGYDDRGVIGLGEPPVISPGAAISNAVANAIGVRVGTLPLTPDKVISALVAGGLLS